MKGDDAIEEEPLETVSNKTQKGGGEEDEPEGEVEEGQAGGPTKGLAEVGGDGEVVELDLGDVEDGLEVGGVGGEVEVGAGEGLDPNCRHQHHPPPPLPPRHGRRRRRRSPARLSAACRWKGGVFLPSTEYGIVRVAGDWDVCVVGMGSHRIRWG